MADATTTERKYLTPTDLETADAVRKVEAVDVPEWGGWVHVRELTEIERGRVDDAIYDDKGSLKKSLLGPAMVAAALCHPDGRPFYAPGDMQAIHTVGSKSFQAVRRLADVTLRLNKMRREDAAEGKADSGETPAGDSPSASPSPPADPT